MGIGCGKGLENRDGQNGAAEGLETEQNDGPLEGDGFGADAEIGSMDELENSRGQGGVAADQGDDVADGGLFVGGHLKDAYGDGGERGKLLKLLKDQLDAPGLKMIRR